MRRGRLESIFAQRYLRAPKSHSIINLISIVSVVATSVPTAAMVILLSVYNGLDDLLKSLYQNFDPEIKITALQGRYFSADSLAGELASVEEIETISYFIEEGALADYEGRQYIAAVRGVDSLYTDVVPIKEMVTRGEYKTMIGDMDAAVVGVGLSYQLGITPALRRPIRLIAPSNESTTFIPSSFYRSLEIMPESIFTIESESDGKYIITSLDFAQRLFSREGEISAVAIKLKDGADLSRVQDGLISRIGDRFLIENRYQQKATLYTVMKYEKLAIYFIIMLVLLIASFSLVGSLIMLIEDKRDHIKMLASIGASESFVKGIFVREGSYIVAVGMILGLAIGVGLTLAQSQFGIIGIEGTTMLVDSYPVRIDLLDMVAVVVSVSAVGYIISLLTVRAMVKKVYNSL